jgi:hypothetical protein
MLRISRPGLYKDGHGGALWAIQCMKIVVQDINRSWGPGWTTEARRCGRRSSCGERARSTTYTATFLGISIRLFAAVYTWLGRTRSP